MPIVIFGIGSNLGNKKSNIIKAKKLLKHHFGNGRLLASASCISSKPLVADNSPIIFSRLHYLNSAIAFNLNQKPKFVLTKIKCIEGRMGRRNNEKWSPRKIDIDILLYEDNQISSSQLTIPHLELLKRDFALIPLIEILNKLEINADEYSNALQNMKV